MANALLDEVGMVDADGDGFRDLPNGEKIVLNMQFATQGIAGEVVEIIAQNWSDVGIQTTVKEVTPDEYRSAQSSNQLDVLMWLKGAPVAVHSGSNGYWVPPFDGYFDLRTGMLWAEYIDSDGASGVEPPEWVADARGRQRLPGGRARLGGAERRARRSSSRGKIVDEMLFIGTVIAPAPVYHRNALKNVPEFRTWSYEYYRTYPTGRRSGTSTSDPAAFLTTCPGGSRPPPGAPIPEAGQGTRVLKFLQFAMMPRGDGALHAVLVSLIVFTLMELVPGNCAERYLAFKNTQGAGDLGRGHRDGGRRLGLDQPFLVRWGDWLGGVFLHGDFGDSCILRLDINDLFGDKFLISLGICLTALLVAYLIAMPVGILAASSRTRLLNGFLRFVSYLGLAMPNFLLALIIMLVSTVMFGDSLTGLFSPEYRDAEWSWARVRISCRGPGCRCSSWAGRRRPSPCRPCAR